MNKQKLTSGVLVLLNSILSFCFLDIKIALLLSGLSFLFAIRFWFGYIELGLYRLATNRNFWSDSQANFIGWFGLLFILAATIFLSAISIVTGMNNIFQ